MKQKIENALARLIGLPLTDAWRPNLKGFETFQRFEFGTQRPTTNRQGMSVSFGEYALHVGCAWRILGQGRILAAYSDLFYPAENPIESGSENAWDACAPGASRRDKQMQNFVERLEAAPLKVERIEADEVGSVRMLLTQGYLLEIMPMDSLPFELWRLLYIGVGRSKVEHFVVTGNGILE